MPQKESTSKRQTKELRLLNLKQTLKNEIKTQIDQLELKKETDKDN